MLNKRALKVEFVRNGMTQKDVAHALGISEQTLIRRLKKGNFGLDEVNQLIEILHINNPCEIFFAKSVT